MGLEELILTTERKRGQIEGRIEGKMEGKIDGKIEGINQVIMNMLSKNLTDEMIADLANVSIDYVQKMRISTAHN